MSGKVGFTGTREGMTNKQKRSFAKLVKLIDVIEFHHGDCVGSDTEAHNIIVNNEKSIAIHIHPPKNPSIRAFNKSEYIYKEKEYLERDHDIVDAANILIATPKTCTEKQRSGTWATIRYAQKADKLILIIKPNGIAVVK